MADAGETLKKTGTRAAQGAAIGSIFPGYGTAIGGAAGAIEGFIESLFSSSDDGGQAATDAAGAEKIRRMDDAYKVLMQQRQQQRQTQLNMLANRMGAYQGANNVLASMYGPQGSMAPNLNLGSGGPTMRGGPGPTQAPSGPPSGSATSLFGGSGPGDYGNLVARPPDPNAGSHAGYTAGSSAPRVGDPNAGTMAGLRAGASAPLVSRMPALSPAISAIAQQMSGPAPAAVRPPLRRAV